MPRMETRHTIARMEFVWFDLDWRWAFLHPVSPLWNPAAALSLFLVCGSDAQAAERRIISLSVCHPHVCVHCSLFLKVRVKGRAPWQIIACSPCESGCAHRLRTPFFLGSSTVHLPSTHPLTPQGLYEGCEGNILDVSCRISTSQCHHPHC